MHVHMHMCMFVVHVCVSTHTHTHSRARSLSPARPPPSPLLPPSLPRARARFPTSLHPTPLYLPRSAVYVTARIAGAIKGLSTGRDLSPVASVRIPVDSSTVTPISCTLTRDDLTPEGMESGGSWWEGKVRLMLRLS